MCKVCCRNLDTSKMVFASNTVSTPTEERRELHSRVKVWIYFYVLQNYSVAEDSRRRLNIEFAYLLRSIIVIEIFNHSINYFKFFAIPTYICCLTTPNPYKRLQSLHRQMSDLITSYPSVTNFCSCSPLEGDPETGALLFSFCEFNFQQTCHPKVNIRRLSGRTRHSPAIVGNFQWSGLGPIRAQKMKQPQRATAC